MEVIFWCLDKIFGTATKCISTFGLAQKNWTSPKYFGPKGRGISALQDFNRHVHHGVLISSDFLRSTQKFKRSSSCSVYLPKDGFRGNDSSNL